jgi:predicted lipoprotein
MTDMKRKSIAIIITLIALIFLGYNSVYFRKLDDVFAERNKKEFNPKVYSKKFWDTKLLPAINDAVEWPVLDSALRSDPKVAFKQYSHALGIGNLTYVLVKAKGTISEIGEDHTFVEVRSGNVQHKIKIETEYIFGNAARDATGLLDINEFTNTMDFNNVSAELNLLIRENVIPPFKDRAKVGDKIEITGAIELNKEHPALAETSVIPVDIKFPE